MKKIILITFILMAGCQKEIDVVPECKQCLYLSDKYNPDNLYDHTDTLWRGQACGRDLDSIKAYKPQWYLICETLTYEYDYYKILR